MLTKDNIQLRAGVFVVAMGFVFLAVFSLLSLDIPVRSDVTEAPDTAIVHENWTGISDNIAYPPPVPPALQKRFLR